VFQILYMVLAAVFHGIVIHDGLHVVLMSDPHGSHLHWVFVLLFTNLLLFIICCHSNPGDLAADGRLLQQSYVSYCYDGQLYHAGVTCPTCNIVRPARSKHCSEYFTHAVSLAVCFTSVRPQLDTSLHPTATCNVLSGLHSTKKLNLLNNKLFSHRVINIFIQLYLVHK